MSPEYAPLGRAELFDRLASGHASGATVVTPNRRLARELLARFDADRTLAGEASWETPDVLPLGAFLERLWDDAVHSHLAPTLPLLITPQQEQAVWEEVVGGSRQAQSLLSPAAAATQARGAWELGHSWRLLERLEKAERNEDASVFLEWSGRFRRVMRDRGLLERALLADALVPLLGDAVVKKPALLVMHAFDIVTPECA